MTGIQFEAKFPDGIKKIEVTAPMGLGGGIFHVMVDRYYHGMMFYKNGDWRIHLNPKTCLQGDDVQILIYRLEKKIDEDEL